MQILITSIRIAACLALLALAAAAEGGPVRAECVLARQGGGIGGCGILARYAAPGPGRVRIERSTVLGHDEDGRAPITLAKVVDPEGRTVAWSELTAQAEATAAVDLPVPPGPAGIWRVSLQGGRANDRVVITAPPAPAWGFRGEMALGLSAATGREGWLWLPPGTGDVLIEAIGGGAVTLADAEGRDLPGVSEGKRALWRWSGLPAGTAVRIAIAPGTKAVAIDGIPGLICPSAEAAADLRGGTVEVGGRIVEGPLQARARRWMLAAVREDLDPHLVFPALPAEVPAPQAAVQLYGAYGPLSGLRASCAAQVLDPSSPDFGSLGGRDPKDRTLHGPSSTSFDPLGLATAVTADVALNPAEGNAALIRRTALMSFYHFARLQGDDLVREGDIAGNGYPMTHAFFVYLGALAGPYALIKDRLDPEAAAVWRDGLILAGDRLADYHGYQTNQFWHVALANLQVYRATGEARFRRWFERQANELLARPATSASKFGQHPAGYFLEEYGPDGNYDAISGTCLVEAWRDYRELPDADPAVTAMLHDAIARDLAFSSCHWLPQPDGSVVGPTSMVTRKVFSFANQGWPGTKFARDEFPLAAAQWLLTAAPESGIGVADLLPHLVNNDAWARRSLAEHLPLGDAKYPTAGRGIPAAWTRAAIRSAQLPVASPGTIPCRAEAGLWELPGQVAWKQGPFYGLVFWGVPGTPPPPAWCRIGGAPTALWTASTGAVLLSGHNAHFEDKAGNNAVEGPDDLTHACVYGRLGEGWWWSGRERATLAWTKPGSACRIAGAGAAAPAAPVTWDYAWDGDGVAIAVAVELAGLDEPALSLPFPERAGAAVALAEGGGARFTAGRGEVAVAWDGSAAATVSAPLPTGIPKVTNGPVRCLRIPLLRDGARWVQRVRFTLVR